ncbi:putative lipoprotein [Neorickettsia helminthoeca str. Oregon]|uniref:Putative lipoprotein n=2 Tax=Neorickettsia helminthoeca TaxID=33994 RepID=X5HJA0_9RICK|nr:putative lipoprotein [Neorickettsia helminthoeca str. Oregon]
MKKYIFTLLLLLVPSCTYRNAIHGYLTESPIKIGERKAVVQIMSGDPTLIDGNNWYYVRINTRSDSVGLRNNYSSTVIQVTFDGEIVKDVKKITMTNEKATHISREGSADGDSKKALLKLRKAFSASESKKD